MRRVFGLDVLRVYAISLVVGFHGRDGGLSLPDWMHVTFGHGYIGVDIFFTLSAWLVAVPLVRGFRQNQIDISRFWIMRWGKTIPPYLVIMAVVGVLCWMHVGTFHSWSAEVWMMMLTFRGNYLSTNTPYDVIWSLAVEEQFYLLLPLVLLVVQRLPRWVSYAVLVVLMVLPVALRIVVYYKWYYAGVYIRDLWLCMDGFVLGTAMVFAKEYQTKLWQTMVRNARFYALSGASIIILLQFLPVLQDDWMCIVVGKCLIPVGTVLLFPFLESWTPRWQWARSVVETVSKGTYAIYLTHSMAIEVAYALPLAPGWGRMGLMLALTGVFSLVLYRLVEVPISAKRQAVVQWYKQRWRTA